MDWPLFDLRLSRGHVVLRPVRDDDLAGLSDLLPIDAEMDPRAEHFAWLGAEIDRRRLLTQGIWRSRGSWSPASWCLHLVVEHRGDLVGLQSLEAEDFAQLRTVDTGSWLTPAARGRGTGVAMRSCVLGLAFDHLGAQAAVSSARHENAASLGVSRRLGYVDNGLSVTDSPSGVVELQHLRLTRERWGAAGGTVTVEGLEACRSWFGSS